MHKRIGLLLVVAVLMGLFISGCDTFLAHKDALAPMAANPVGKDYLVVFNGNNLPKNTDGLVANAGGQVKMKFAQIEVVLATAQASSFVTNMSSTPGVKYVLPDVKLNWLPGEDYKTVLPADQAGPMQRGDHPEHWR